MKRKILAFTGIVVLLTAFVVAPAGAVGGDVVDLPIPVDIDDILKEMPAPAQPSAAEAEAIVAASTTTDSLCGADGSSLTITITSFDPANPGSQDVVFWRETPVGGTGKATLWVAWDFLTTYYGSTDEITCPQLAQLQTMMDSIVDTDVYYFGEYVQRPAGNENIDVMIYNIVDESFFDPDYPFYIAGFFWSSLNVQSGRNMIFIDSLDWANRTGPDALHPYLYEGTVAHELTHLIANDHDADEESWVEEGLTDLSEYLNGFGHPDGHVVYFLAYHRTPLTVWGGGLEDYGASYLFQLYLLEQFGTRTPDGPYAWDNTWTLGMIVEQQNGIGGIQSQIEEQVPGGPAFNELFDSWILANYLDDPSLDGPTDLPLGYGEINLKPFVSRAYSPWSIRRSISDIYGSDHRGALPLPRYYGGWKSGTVEYPAGTLPPYAGLYGTYGGIQPMMHTYLKGDAQSGIAPYGGVQEVASGGGNLLTDRMLQVAVPVGGTLTFWTWYDIEEEWDYGFVEASVDDGVTWAPIAGSITRISDNPNDSTAWANSLVGGQDSTNAAITGSSGGWVEAVFTLPATSDVLVRFSYYTDEATLGKGWFIDDVSVDGFSDGFEDGADNWDLGGWTRTTGLFDNDWLMAYVNPVYERGKFGYLDYGYLGWIGNGYQIIQNLLNTRALTRDEVMLVIANRPQASPFEASYMLLVNKRNASN